MKFRYDDQIASQPDAVAAILARRPAELLDLSRPVLLCGLGSSLHAARVGARFIEDRGGSARAIESHDLSLRFPRHVEQVVAVSHRGATGFAADVLARAHAAGARTFAVVGEDAPPPVADVVVRTCRNETAGTHTVSYLTAVTALGQLAGVDLAEAPRLLRETLQMSAPVAVAKRLAGKEPVLVAGVGGDAITADEAALKLKEGAFVWAEGTSVELALHGPLAALRPSLGAITFTPPFDDGGRTARLREALAAIGMTAVTCGPAQEDLRFAPCSVTLRPLLSIVPLQRLAAELARLTGGDPDQTRANVEPWRTALALAR